MSNKQKNCDKLSALVDKKINQTVNNLVKITMFCRFLLDEKMIINICFS